MSKKTKTQTSATSNAGTMSLAPSHTSNPEMFQGTQPGVTVEVTAPTPDQLAAMGASGVPSATPAKRARKAKGPQAAGAAQTTGEAPAGVLTVAKPAKAPKGPSHQEVVALLQATGLPVTEKSSSHYGGTKGAKTLKGPRLVLPRSNTVTRLYLYDMPDAISLLGYHTPEQRKAKGLGAVTHSADVTTLDQVKALIAAVCEANGIQLKQDGTPKAKRSRKSTPAQGVPTTEPEAK